MGEAKVRAGEKKRKRVVKRALTFAVVIVGVGALIFVLVRFPGDGDAGVSAAISPIGEGDWTKGNPDAAVTLVEYSDFQCPACRSYFPIVQALTGEFGNEVLFAYRHLPLTQIHFNAEAAARAANAAGEQGKFWEMHDMLFQNQPVWASSADAESIFIAYAAGIRLNMEQFNSDFNSEEDLDSLRDAYADALRSGINSTPTFFLNGERIPNPSDLDEFRDVIRGAIEQSG